MPCMSGLCPPGVGEKDYASSPLHFMFIYLFFSFLTLAYRMFLAEKSEPVIQSLD